MVLSTAAVSCGSQSVLSTMGSAVKQVDGNAGGLYLALPITPCALTFP
jgi:hypothetical protein